MASGELESLEELRLTGVINEEEYQWLRTDIRVASPLPASSVCSYMPSKSRRDMLLRQLDVKARAEEMAAAIVPLTPRSAEARTHANDECESPLYSLPADAIVAILLFLAPREAARFGEVCKRFHEIANRPELWKEFAERSPMWPLSQPEIGALDSVSEGMPELRLFLTPPESRFWKRCVVWIDSIPPQSTGVKRATDDSAYDYGRIRIGSQVLLLRHRAVKNDENWNSSMDKYVGKMGTVNRLSGIDSSGSPGVRVNVDGKDTGFFFRVRDVRLVRK
eukprot:m51a1_g738 hypothetical protein (278) ;mRNA; r:492307-493669